MEQRRVEDDGPVRPVRHGDVGVPRRLEEPPPHEVGVCVVLLEGPVRRRLRREDDEAAGFRVEVGRVVGEPNVDVDGRLVGVQVDPRVFRIVLVRPHVPEGMSAEDPGQGVVQILRQVEQNPIVQAVVDVRADVPSELQRQLGLVPDRRIVHDLLH